MIDFDIDIDQMTPYRDLLESLIQQSHALSTIHNPKTWCLSALTYALHLNDCLVLFEDLKNRWQKELPFAEAWDVNFQKWKSDIWTAVNNTKSTTSDDWKSLCDTDYAQFIELSNKVADGEITIAPLLQFVEGKETSIGKIIVDAGRKLSGLFTEIEDTINGSSTELYQSFYDGCIEGNKNIHVDDLYDIKGKTYEKWAASKTLAKRPEAIRKLIASISKEIENSKTFGEMWGDCYDANSNTIDSESISRELFINRASIISNKSYNYKESLDKLFYTVTMIEFLQEKLNEITKDEERPKTPEELENDLKRSNAVFKTQFNGRPINFTKFRSFLKEHVADSITYKYEWYSIYLFAYVHEMLADSQLSTFAEQMNKPEWFDYVVDRKKCVADSMGDYNFFLSNSQNKWEDVNIIPSKSNATPTGQRKVLHKYNLLNMEFDENLICD